MHSYPDGGDYVVNKVYVTDYRSCQMPSQNIYILDLLSFSLIISITYWLTELVQQNLFKKNIKKIKEKIINSSKSYRNISFQEPFFKTLMPGALYLAISKKPFAQPGLYRYTFLHLVAVIFSHFVVY